MTVNERDLYEILIRNLPRIAKALERIADSLEEKDKEDCNNDSLSV